MTVRVVACKPGDLYFPWNYGQDRDDGGGRVARQTLPAGRGEVALNAIGERRRVLGSARALLGARSLTRVITCDEYAYGGIGPGSSGPYLWPDRNEPWIVLLRGIWVRPQERRRGIARLLVEHVRQYGLPTYVSFANKAMQAWFAREMRPAQPSALQVELEHAIQAVAPDDGGEFREYPLRASIAAERRVITTNFAELYDDLQLDELILDPPRADWEILDSGSGEEELTDTAFATDRSYGYDINVDAVRLVDEHPEADMSGDHDDSYYDEIDSQVIEVHLTGTVEVWDTRAVRAYAALRHLVRTGTSWTPGSTDEAICELFVDDFAPLPKHTVSFEAELGASGSRAAA